MQGAGALAGLFFLFLFNISVSKWVCGGAGAERSAPPGGFRGCCSPLRASGAPLCGAEHLQPGPRNAGNGRPNLGGGLQPPAWSPGGAGGIPRPPRAGEGLQGAASSPVPRCARRGERQPKLAHLLGQEDSLARRQLQEREAFVLAGWLAGCSVGCRVPFSNNPWVWMELIGSDNLAR